MTTEVTTLQSLASEAASWFETATRGDTGRDEDRYVRLRDGRPDWVFDLVCSAHDDMFPDDWRYEAISSACEAISESSEPEDKRAEWADSYVDVYTSDLLAWLGSRLTRSEYVDEAVEEFGHSSNGIIGDIALGQYFEAEEVYGLVLQALEGRLQEIEDDVEDEEVSE